jgi:hypothetical protein
MDINEHERLPNFTLKTQIIINEQLVDNVFFVPTRVGPLIIEKVTTVMSLVFGRKKIN